MTEEAFDPLRVVAALDAHGVRYVLVGDLAAMAYGAPRSADRIEMCVAEDDDDIARLGTVLQALAAEQDEATGDPQRVGFRTSAGRVECVEMPDVGGYAALNARATNIDMGRGVIARVAAAQDVAGQQLASDDLVGAVRTATLGEDRLEVHPDEDEYGPEPAALDGRRNPLRRVWRTFEDIDRFMSDLNEGTLPWSRDRRR
jgi:hypothetical protein